MAADAGDATNKKSRKVELDIEDAPFLNDEPPAEEQKKAEAQKAPAAREDGPVEAKPGLVDRLKARKKILLFALLGLLLMAGAAVAVNILLPGGDKKTPEPVPQTVQEAKKEEPQPKEDPATTKGAEAPTKTVIVDNKPPKEEAAPTGPRFTLDWAPFMLELQDTEGTIRILTIKFTFQTDDEPVYIEMLNKERIIRDSIYYHLLNRPFDTLVDSSKLPALKDGVIKAINDNIRNGELKIALIDFYHIN